MRDVEVEEVEDFLSVLSDLLKNEKNIGEIEGGILHIKRKLSKTTMVSSGCLIL